MQACRVPTWGKEARRDVQREMSSVVPRSSVRGAESAGTVRSVLCSAAAGAGGHGLPLYLEFG